MQIAAIRESWPGERRVALDPPSVQKLRELGFEVQLETNCGLASGFRDADYAQAGATVADRVPDLLTKADIVVGVRPPTADNIQHYKKGAIHIGFLDPYRETELVQALKQKHITSISLEMVPRSTRAQKLDALSSQASLAGYAAMIVAAYHTPRIFPLMMTPSGTLTPARVFVIGAGVAGLQAIATAHRLGARIEAFDTRPVVKEEVQSLGAKFLEIDLGEMGQTEQGYAQELTEEQRQLQQKGMADAVARSNIVVTTAQVFGRIAPRIVTLDMIKSMAQGSVVVDMAVESGGNVEGSKVDENVEVDGVTVIGMANLPSQVATHASQMYSSNILALISELAGDSGEVSLNTDNEILEATLVTQGGDITNKQIREIT